MVVVEVMVVVVEVVVVMVVVVEVHTHRSGINIYFHERGIKVKLSSTYQVMSTCGHTHTYTLLQWLVLCGIGQENFFPLPQNYIFSSFVPLYS